jgi:cell division septation protein DedD
MIMKKVLIGAGFALLLAICGCSRQQSDWERARSANTTDSYEQFLKKYPSGEFTAQAQARARELYEERDWQKARDADTQEAYQAFLKQYPEGKWSEEARIRVENFTLAQTPPNGTPAGAQTAKTPGNAAAGESPAAPAPKPSGAGAQTPAVTNPPRTTAAKATTPSAREAYRIQLGAFKSSADAAHKHWARLDKEFPKLLAGLSPTVVPKKTASGTLFRLQVAGLAEKRARAICSTLKAKSQACVLIRPAHRAHH